MFGAESSLNWQYLVSNVISVQVIAINYYVPSKLIRRNPLDKTNAIEAEQNCGVDFSVISDNNSSNCVFLTQAHNRLQAVITFPNLMSKQHLSIEVILLNVDDCSSPAWTWFTESRCLQGVYTECSSAHRSQVAEFTHCVVTCVCYQSCDFLFLKYNRLPLRNQTMEQLCEIRVP